MHDNKQSIYLGDRGDTFHIAGIPEWRVQIFKSQIGAMLSEATLAFQRLPEDDNFIKGVEKVCDETARIYGLRVRAWQVILFRLQTKKMHSRIGAEAIQAACQVLTLSLTSGDDLQKQKEVFEGFGLRGTEIVLRCGGRKRPPGPLDYEGWLHAAYENGGGWPNYGSQATRKTRVARRELSQSQMVARRRIEHSLSVRGSNVEYVRGIWARPFLLLTGPSGTGKTTVAEDAAISKKVLCHVLGAAEWVVEGARTTGTLERLTGVIKAGTKGILVIDEIDKLFGTTDWTRHCQVEVMAVLDGRLRSHGWNTDQVAAWRNWLIVGIGTWQARQYSRSIGFPHKSQHMFFIDDQSEIPDELLFRFNSDVIYLDPPGVDFYAKKIAEIHESLEIGDPNIADLAREAAESGRHMRWLETYLARLIYQHDEDNLPQGVRRYRYEEESEMELF